METPGLASLLVEAYNNGYNDGYNEAIMVMAEGKANQDD
jgi:hypothetical protein